jgi:hypothetical protein
MRDNAGTLTNSNSLVQVQRIWSHMQTLDERLLRMEKLLLAVSNAVIVAPANIAVEHQLPSVPQAHDQDDAPSKSEGGEEGQNTDEEEEHDEHQHVEHESSDGDEDVEHPENEDSEDD